ncbi:MAG: hypothetical protein D6731_03585 [Planctomycetota bacterium]|nr:MAG: hypothetical protein D6731_03585 [Planctomycetota bacterium]
MQTPSPAGDDLRLGDKLLARGWPCLAAKAYARAADRLIAEGLLRRARAEVEREPRRALDTLRRVEALAGPCAEGLRLLAEAYRALGQPEVARRFARAAEAPRTRRQGHAVPRPA